MKSHIGASALKVLFIPEVKVDKEDSTTETIEGDDALDEEEGFEYWHLGDDDSKDALVIKLYIV